MKRIALLLILSISSSIVWAQVGINTSTPEGTLDIVSTNDTGLVIPRVSSVENVTDGQGNPPQNGTIVFDLSRGATCFYSNNKWLCTNINAQGDPVLIEIIPYNIDKTYIKASNTDSGDEFGRSIALSSDGNTLAVGVDYEDSNATGINGDQSNNSFPRAGAVYVFTRSGTTWSQQAYIKASNTKSTNYFGKSIALNSDGNTLIVGAYQERSNATGINGDQNNVSAVLAGAVYVFSRSGTTWSQQE